MTPLVEAYLLIDQPRQRLGHWTKALAALDSSAAPPLASVVALYDPTTDQAMLNLRYDELALGPQRLEFVIEVALLAEVGMIQPAELSDGERRRFLTERLARCTLQIQSERSAVGALTELVRRLRDQRNGSRPPPFKERGDTNDPVPLVSAKGTRDDIPQLERRPKTNPDGSSDVARITPARARTNPGLAQGSSGDVEPEKFPRPTSPHRHVVTRSSRAATVVAADLPEEYVNEFDDPASTEPAPSDSQSLPQVTPIGSETNTIYARYLRSGKWVPIRIGALSLKGAALMTGALPRLHDHVDVALSYAGHRALVRGAVGKVSTMTEAVQTGASTFSVAFELDQASRRQLTALLTAARAANVTIKPPPPRATRRFVVEWPVCLGTMRGAMKADALDISTTGMFVRPVVALTIDTVLNFSVVLDDGNGPVAGRAKVVRRLTDVEAAACGLAAGFGLSVVEMGTGDEQRWNAFIARIERRAEKRVLVGAAPQRLDELQTVLSGAGYAVMGGTDPGTLVQLASTDARPVDAALIDETWLGNTASTSWVESLFSARNVPCVTVRGDTRRARAQLDELLAVAGPKNHNHM
ncbi:MAG TPA: PilZ domain-containing protein, partial [Kofleriaceae bacterium]|nr:PilZ domain-containing protein [Kofleriaceae bacterium]